MYFHSAMIFQGHSCNNVMADYKINERWWNWKVELRSALCYNNIPLSQHFLGWKQGMDFLPVIFCEVWKDCFVIEARRGLEKGNIELCASANTPMRKFYAEI